MGYEPIEHSRLLYRAVVSIVTRMVYKDLLEQTFKRTTSHAFGMSLRLRTPWLILCALLLLASCAPEPAEKTEASLTLKVRLPTSCIGTFTYSVELTDQNKDGIGDQRVRVDIDGQEFERLKTDQNGRFSSSIDMRPEWCNADVIITATFDGNERFTSTETTQTIRTSSCDDGTALETCSKKAGYYCGSDANLIFDCDKCGCDSGLTCKAGKCAPATSSATQVISRLQNHIVLVNQTYGTGSGIVLAQPLVRNETQTVILTNNHVIEGAYGASDVRIFSDGQRAIAKRLYVAPKNIDLAIIIVPGAIGTPVERVNVSGEKGQAVVALGSPLGFTGSVSKGIISNFVINENKNYTFAHVQTDAAINPGNSGGGLFLESDGGLVGINTYGYSETEGLGFAIDYREINALPPYTDWLNWTAPYRCSDGTPLGYCSNSQPLACVGGELDMIGACQSCGCPDDRPVCHSDGGCGGYKDR